VALVRLTFEARPAAGELPDRAAYTRLFRILVRRQQVSAVRPVGTARPALVRDAGFDPPAGGAHDHLPGLNTSGATTQPSSSRSLDRYVLSVPGGLCRRTPWGSAAYAGPAVPSASFLYGRRSAGPFAARPRVANGSGFHRRGSQHPSWRPDGAQVACPQGGVRLDTITAGGRTGRRFYALDFKAAHWGGQLPDGGYQIRLLTRDRCRTFLPADKTSPALLPPCVPRHGRGAHHRVPRPQQAGRVQLSLPRRDPIRPV